MEKLTVFFLFHLVTTDCHRIVALIVWEENGVFWSLNELFQFEESVVILFALLIKFVNLVVIDFLFLSDLTLTHKISLQQLLKFYFLQPYFLNYFLVLAVDFVTEHVNRIFILHRSAHALLAVHIHIEYLRSVLYNIVVIIVNANESAC